MQNQMENFSRAINTMGEKMKILKLKKNKEGPPLTNQYTQ